MIKLKLRQLVRMVETRDRENPNQSILDRFLALKKPLDLAWRNRGAPTRVAEELKLFNELKFKLCEQHGGIKSERGYDIPKEQAASFVKEYDELLEQEVSLDLQPTPLSIFSGEWSEAEMSALEPLVEVPRDP